MVTRYSRLLGGNTGKAFFNLREGIRQAGMLAFPFAAAREREKLAKRVSHRLREGIRQAEHLLFYADERSWKNELPFVSWDYVGKFFHGTRPLGLYRKICSPYPKTKDF